jgi:hypothetical protein
VKWIAHRGNINGKNPEMENNPVYIKDTLEAGYDVEIDTWKIGDQLFLGHDKPIHRVGFEFLKGKHKWVHCKNIEAFMYLYNDVNCFFQSDEEIVLTSERYLWAHSKCKVWNHLTVITQLDSRNWIPPENAFAVCSDYCSDIYRTMDNKTYVDLVNSMQYPDSIRVPLDKPFVDNRGVIQNLWLGQSGSITLIESKGGAVRAQHKHIVDTDFHATFIVKGKIKYTEINEDNSTTETIFSNNDMFFTKPHIFHTMYFIEDTVMITINGILKNHENYEKSIVRMDDK